MEITVKHMEFCDVSSVEQIEKECFSTPWSFDCIKSELENKFGITLVALVEDKIVGFLNAHCVFGEGNINNVAVTESFRKKGVGKTLIEKILDYGEKNCVEFFTLEVRKSNQNAIAFYEKFGFSPIGERKNFYEKPTENAILMIKKI